MDFFGKALRNYQNGDKKSNFSYHQNCFRKKYDDKKFDINLGRYFRTYEELYRLEKKMIGLVHDNILDIGCNTGYYMKSLMEHGNAVGIDISGEIIQIAHDNGLLNCYKGDIFEYQFNRKFDTITLFESDLAITGSIRYLKKLLRILKSLLKKEGQVLAIIRHLPMLKYWNVVYTQEYQGKIGTPFRCCYVNVSYLARIAGKLGFRLEILDKEIIEDNTILYLIKLANE
jgi:SAM-dependent methyltransferase